jgi:Apea-like HEPN
MPLHPRALQTCVQYMRSVVETFRPQYANLEASDEAARREALDWYHRRDAACEKIANQLLKQHEFRKKYSKKALVNEMIAASHILLTDNEIDLKEGITRAIEHLETIEVEWRCLYPLSGIAFYDIDELPLGSTTIRVMTKQYIDDWLTEMETTLSKNESLHQDVRRRWHGTYSEVIEAYRSEEVTEDTTFPEKEDAQVYAEVRAIGDLNKAREIADAEIRSVIDILRYACTPLFIFDTVMARHIGLQGEYGQGPRDVEMIPSTYLGHGHSYTAGRLHPMLLDRTRKDRLAEWGVLVLGNLLRIPDSQYILDALHWFAESLTQAESGHAFLCLAVGLETLFGVDEPVQRQGEKEFGPVARGVAHVIGGDMETRRDTFATMNHLYQLRNAVAHGRIRHVEESDLRLMRLAVQQVVKEIATRAAEFSPKLRLLEWIREQESIPDLY